MRSFYSKIFLSFWASMAIIVVGAVLASTLIITQRLASLQDSRPGQLAEAAGASLREGGREGLRRWLESQTDSIPDLRIYIVDDARRELLDRWVPNRLLRRLQTVERLQESPPTNYRPARFAPQLVGPDGKVYTVIVLNRRTGPFGLLAFPGIPGTTLLLALVVSGVVSFLLARSFSRPVAQLQAATRELSGGRLAARVGDRLAGRRDELAALGRDFDGMAEHLQRLVEGQRRLLQDVSHELRSPLTRLRVALDLARRRNDPRAELDRIEREAGRLDQLIARILELARLSGGGGEPASEAVDLVELVDTVVEDASFEAKVRGIDIRWDPPAEGQTSGDRELLASAIENVVRNAVRYTPEDDSVEVTLAQGAEGFRLAIRDHGPGVPESELPRLFEPFYRVAEARERESGGEGLGLAITARVVSLHGGITSALNHPDGGLVVTLGLPRRPI